MGTLPRRGTVVSGFLDASVSSGTLRVEVLEDAFLQHGAPRHIISDQEGIFASEVFAALLRDWNTKQRSGAVGKHGSIAVTERAILTLKYEWLRRVPVI